MTLDGLWLGPNLMRMENDEGVNESGKCTCLFLPSSGKGEDEPGCGGYWDEGMLLSWLG
jgi:hypothetical protein